MNDIMEPEYQCGLCKKTFKQSTFVTSGSLPHLLSLVILGLEASHY
jgi:hypothetical protein